MTYLSYLRQANSCVVNQQYADAIEILEPLVNSDTSNIQGVISFCLGDIYRCCDSIDNYNDLAKKHLSRAIKLAWDTGDSQVVVAAKAALAQVETELGNEDQARQYRQEARDEFQALPEVAKWEDLAERLEDNNINIQYLLFQSICSDCTINGINGRSSGSQGICKGCGIPSPN